MFSALWRLPWLLRQLQLQPSRLQLHTPERSPIQPAALFPEHTTSPPTPVPTRRSRSTPNASGEFRINLLPVGTYTVKITAAGFKTFQQSGVVLDLGQSASLNAQLTVGGAEETIDVTTAVPLVNTTTSEVGATVQNVEIENLPIVNRNVYDLLSLVPGASVATLRSTKTCRSRY
jgi:hypothetical protein